MIRSRTPHVQTPTNPHGEPPPGAVAALLDGITGLLHRHSLRTIPAPPMSARRMVDTVGPDVVGQHAEEHAARLAAQLQRLTGHNPVAELLAAAGAKLVARGWARGIRTGSRGRVCIRGALDATGRPEGDRTRDRAEELLLVVIRERHPRAESIERFNDRLCAGLDDAAAVFADALHLALAGGGYR